MGVKTMTCENFYRFLDLFVDGELSPEENAEMMAHLESCERCRTLAEAEIILKEKIRDANISKRAPKSLRSQVHQAVSREASSFWRSRVFFGGALAIGVSASALLVVVLLHSKATPEDLSDLAVQNHEEVTGQEVFGDAQKVTKFLETHAPFKFKIPLQPSPSLNLVGAKVTNLGSRPAVFYFYDCHGKRLSVAQYPEKKAKPSSPHVFRKKQYLVATYDDNGLAHTVVGDMKEAEVLNFLPAGFVEE
jgi:anti-sigma factor (TIGR02949 family)